MALEPDMETHRDRASPRIFVDGLNLALVEGTGVATYGRTLLSSLVELGCQAGVLFGLSPEEAGEHASGARRKRNRWIKLARNAASVMRSVAGVRCSQLQLETLRKDIRSRLPDRCEILNVSRLFGLANDYFDMFGKPLKVLLHETPDIMHWTYPVPIQVVGAKNIYTMHDLVPVRLPHTTLDRKLRYLKLMRMLAEHADHIVTVSDASRQDIISLLDVEPERVTNTFQPVDVSADILLQTSLHEQERLIDQFGLGRGNYFIFFGAIEPKKNVDRLLQAYFSANLDTPLVLVGKAAWKSEEQLRMLDLDRVRSDAARASGVSVDTRPRVVRIEYVDRAALMTLVAGAKALVFPSVYEGFGLPVVEAMALGTPVITSSTGSLPEITGNAALLVDPYDVQAIASAIRTLDRDAPLRRRLSAAGTLQAAQFSGEFYGARLARLYGGLGVELGGVHG